MTLRVQAIHWRWTTAAGSLLLGLLLMALPAGHDTIAAAETVREHPDERLGALGELDDYKDIVAPETLQFEPGSRWKYSNTGFLLLGVIVSQVSGMDYYDYIRENIYRAAGMNNTDHYEITRPNPHLATGYWKDEGEWRKNILFMTPRGTSAGGGYSTVEDLLAFDLALRSNKLLSEEMRELLFAPDPERNSPSYGYGFMIGGLSPDRQVGHGGSYPGVSAELAMFLDSGYTFVALCNGGGAQTAYAKVLALIERAK